MPRNVSIVSESPSSVVFKADAPKKDGGKPITEWKLEYSREEDYGGDKMEMVFKNGRFLELLLYSVSVCLSVYLSVFLKCLFLSYTRKQNNCRTFILFIFYSCILTSYPRMKYQFFMPIYNAVYMCFKNSLSYIKLKHGHNLSRLKSYYVEKSYLT